MKNFIGCCHHYTNEHSQLWRMLMAVGCRKSSPAGQCCHMDHKTQIVSLPLDFRINKTKSYEPNKFDNRLIFFDIFEPNKEM